MTTLRDWTAATLRMLIVSVVTATIIILVLTIAFRSQAQREQDTADEIRRANLATVCVLALPTSDAGRDQSDVYTCLRRYGLAP